MQRRQKILLISAVLALIGVLLIAAVAWLFLAKGRMLIFKHPGTGFSVKYPKAWEATKDENGIPAIFRSPLESALDTVRENVNIVVQDLSANPMPLEEYTKIAERQMKLVFSQDLEVLESSEVRFAGQPAHKFLYIGRAPNTGDLKILHYWTIIDNKAYQFTFTSAAAKYNQYIGVVNRMARSFKVR